MISQCPHCEQPLRFSAPQTEKFKQALARLPQGRTLKFGCPKCRVPIEVNREGRLDEKVKKEVTDRSPDADAPVDPPSAPDISWLATGGQETDEVLDDVPTAMVLIRDRDVLGQVSEVLKGQNLQIHTPDSADDAVSSLRFKAYDVIVYSSDYEDGPVDVHDFHRFMSGMSMNRRRKIFYVLVGQELNTLYDLEALTRSANLVVNRRELPYFDRVFQMGKKEYDRLFGPYLSMLNQHGKS